MCGRDGRSEGVRASKSVTPPATACSPVRPQRSTGFSVGLGWRGRRRRRGWTTCCCQTHERSRAGRRYASVRAIAPRLGHAAALRDLKISIGNLERQIAVLLTVRRRTADDDPTGDRSPAAIAADGAADTPPASGRGSSGPGYARPPGKRGGSAAAAGAPSLFFFSPLRPQPSQHQSAHYPPIILTISRHSFAVLRHASMTPLSAGSLSFSHSATQSSQLLAHASQQ